MAGPISGSGIPTTSVTPTLENHNTTQAQPPSLEAKTSAVATAVIALSDNVPSFEELDFDSFESKISEEIQNQNLAARTNTVFNDVIATTQNEVIAHEQHSETTQQNTTQTHESLSGIEHQLKLIKQANAQIEQTVAQAEQKIDSTIQVTAKTKETVAGANEQEQKINNNSEQLINKAKAAKQNAIVTEVKVADTIVKKETARVEVKIESHTLGVQEIKATFSKGNAKELDEITEVWKKKKLDSAGEIQKSYARLSVRGNFVVIHKLTSNDRMMQKTLNDAYEGNKKINNHNEVSFSLSAPDKGSIAHIDGSGVGLPKEFQAAHANMPIYNEEEVAMFGENATLEELQNAGITPLQTREMTAEQSDRFDVLLKDYVTAHVTLAVLQRLQIETANTTQLSQQAPIQQQVQFRAGSSNRSESNDDVRDIKRHRAVPSDTALKNLSQNQFILGNEVKLNARQRKNLEDKKIAEDKENKEDNAEKIKTENKKYNENQQDIEIQRLKDQNAKPPLSNLGENGIDLKT